MGAFSGELGGWEIGSVIGRGAQSQVYRLHKSVAGHTLEGVLKVIALPTPEQKKAWRVMDAPQAAEWLHALYAHVEREILLGRRLADHPNVVPIEDVYTLQHPSGFGLSIGLRMPMLIPLSGWTIPSGGGLFQWYGDMKAALEACHSLGYCHGDVKPENMFSIEKAKGSLYKLGDFGIARGLQGGSRAWQGAPAYRDPNLESAAAIKDMAMLKDASRAYAHGAAVAMAADWYALHVILYTFLNGGRLPLQKPGEDIQMALSRRFDHWEVPPPTDYQATLGAVVAESLHPDSRCRAAPETVYRVLQEAVSAQAQKRVQAQVQETIQTRAQGMAPSETQEAVSAQAQEVAQMSAGGVKPGISRVAEGGSGWAYGAAARRPIHLVCGPKSTGKSYLIRQLALRCGMRYPKARIGVMAPGAGYSEWADVAEAAVKIGLRWHVFGLGEGHAPPLPGTVSLFIQSADPFRVLDGRAVADQMGLLSRQVDMMLVDLEGDTLPGFTEEALCYHFPIVADLYMVNSIRHWMARHARAIQGRAGACVLINRLQPNRFHRQCAEWAREQLCAFPLEQNTPIFEIPEFEPSALAPKPNRRWCQALDGWLDWIIAEGDLRRCM